MKHYPLSLLFLALCLISCKKDLQHNAPHYLPYEDPYRNSPEGFAPDLYKIAHNNIPPVLRFYLVDTAFSIQQQYEENRAVPEHLIQEYLTEFSAHVIDSLYLVNTEEGGLFLKNQCSKKDFYKMSIYLSGSQNIDLLCTITSGCPHSAVVNHIHFYNKNEQRFLAPSHPHNIYNMYHRSDSSILETSNLIPLLKDFLPDLPEIEETDYNHDGISDFTFRRLYHVGTVNAEEITILQLNKDNSAFDTLCFSRDYIRSWE